MRKPDSRSVFTYAIITIVGLALLMLVLPNIVPIQLLGAVFVLVPLVALAAFVIYLRGTSKADAKPASRQVSRSLADIAAISAVLSVVITDVSTEQSPYGPHTLRYVYENIGVALLFTAFACVLLLINRQKFVYWPFWNTKDRRASDERQHAVRNRVYEKSYRALIVVLVAGGLFSGNHSQRLHDELFQVAVLCVFGLPAVIAAWQKDS